MFYNGQPTVQFFNLVTQIAMTGNSTNKLTSNIDGTEIAKFEAMAPIWWDKQGDFKALHDINVLRVNYINERVALTGKSLLDAGCGGGILSEAMASLGAVVTGIDMGEAALGVARLHLKESGLQVDYQQATTEQFAETHADRFDVVTCLELLVAIIGAEYILGLVRRGTHTYGKFIKPAELRGWAADSGLAFKDLTGLHYNPILRKYSMGGNTHVNYLMHYRKI
jgi:2-polyprenyl-6-hydroxyphenyl methylase/3-demethylubiquinone-9 3-methyltransferase